ncbi:LANO_0E12178g1_1 [Lachancea nothofagi CBS 11611]|uniref:THO complex subunit 2 n=1 Tax=Lachancea nothofagi CBS 11611 TaxID=1266666 RepID=A0A1G4JXY8_9SACH|nr:LANO_0E12178g1_1 [Lachancea nothofagi CBS 11611]
MSSICSQINELSSDCSINFVEGLSLSAEACNDWDSLTQGIVDKLTNCNVAKERKKHTQLVFYEILLLLSDHNVARPLDVEKACRLIQKVYSVEGTKTARIFTALVNSFPEKSERLLALIRSLKMMDEEFCTHIADDKLLEKTGKFSVKQRALFKKSLLDSRYIIQKYNLLSEHPVAFSELLTLLLIAYNDPTNVERASMYWQETQCIIGKYALDPLRALDVILVVSSHHITENYAFLIRFLQVSSYWPAVKADCQSAEGLSKGGNIIAAQILTMHLNEAAVGVKFYDMTCVLIKAGLVSFLSIFDNLGPDDDTIQQFADCFYADLEADSMKGSTNPLALAAALTDDPEEDGGLLPKDQAKPSSSEQEPSQEDLEAEKEREKKQILEGGKMMLLHRLLAHGSITPFLYAFQNYSRFLLVSDLTSQLYLRLFEFSINPLYKTTVLREPTTKDPPKGLIRNHNAVPPLHGHTNSTFYYQESLDDVPTVATIEQLFESCHQWLTIMGPQLALNVCVVAKLCRIGLKDIESNENKAATLEAWLNFTRKFLLPAFPLLYDNVIVLNEAYELLRCFGFERRYFLYNELCSKLSQDNIFVKVGWNKSARDAKTELKSLSIDNVNKKGKNFAKLVSRNPLSALEPVMNQLENYDKLSDLVVETSLYFSPFAYDVLQYHILLRLTSGRQSLQESGVHVTMWVQRIAVFVASLAKHSPKMDIGNIVRFVIKKLHGNDMIAVTVIRELISRVCGVKAMNDLSPKQLLMLHSGRPLQEAARTVIRDTRDDNQTAALKLLNIFIEQNALSEVIILLDHMKSAMMRHDSHYKVLSSRIDEIGLLLWSFIDMSKYFLGPKKFTDNIVPFDQLVSKYALSVEWAFFIWREYYDNCANEKSKLKEEFDAAIDNAKLIPDEFKGEYRELFANFWKLSLYDVCFRKELYDEEKSFLQRSLAVTKSISKKREISKQLESIMASRIAHQRAHTKCQDLIRGCSLNMDHLKATGMVKSFLQYCVLPRALFSPADALYVVDFIWETFHFAGALRVFEELVSARLLVSLLFSSTSSEASNLGLFFTTYLEKLEELRKADELSNENLRRLFKIQSLIAEDVINLIMEKNYMSIRNGIEFMKYLSTVFPVVEFDILQMIQAMENLIAIDKREDILLPSNALVGHLKARLKNALALDVFYKMSPEDQVDFRFGEKELIMKHHKALLKEGEEKRLRLNSEREAEERQSTEELKNQTGEERNVTSSPYTRFGRLPPLPMYEILNEMRDVIKCLEANRSEYLNRHVRNKALLTELREIERDTVQKPKEYKDRLAEVLEAYFTKLVTSPNHEKFQQRLNGIIVACKSVTNPYGAEKIQKGRSLTQAIAYDDEPIPIASRVPTNRSTESRTTKGSFEDSKRTSRYSGAKGTEQDKDLHNKAANFEKRPVFRNDKDQNEAERSVNKGRSTGTSEIKIPKGPSLGAENRLAKAGSRYVRKPVTTSNATANEFSKKEYSPIPRGPARSSSNIRTKAVSESRFGDMSTNKTKISERSRTASARPSSTKRLREEPADTFPSKRNKPESSTIRPRYASRERGDRERPASRQESSYGGRYENKPRGDSRPENITANLPSGPKVQTGRPQRGGNNSQGQKPSSTPQSSRYQK